MFRTSLAATALVMTGLPAMAHETGIDRIAAFFEGADIVSGPSEVECTLSGGATTSCFQITVRPNPPDYTPGPWCPTNIADDAEKGGIWFLDGKAVEVDGDFIANLAETYGDTEWQLFDKDTGEIRFTGTLEACEAAARPDVDPDYQNYCVQCQPEYLPEDASVTYVIPMHPEPADEPQPTQMGSGVALNGVRLDGPAPLDAILGAHTIAPFDDCGGHVNTHVGYHYHAVTDCLEGGQATVDAGAGTLAEHGGQIGIAMDGHPIFAHLMADGSEPADLDACFGHEAEGLPYHYHAGAAGSNQILGCLKAQTGCTLEEEGGTCDASRRRGPPPR
ncbi:YHYH protein [Paracoccus sp. 1_MG-2023]|uniref:YHYH protein n=1 Tax=unclassified Paracoccus (in: a-proteobacteria) TaxID=2688777 RepID=UPI001C09F1E3|nr:MULTISPECIES: YHYH protein [unclassified Paracoccus (in: a-proteobacteria)]MBU2957823.1 YHYH protein [Paracoccus sp. C2R09]MDO6667329.1 YHYH protein [Paracoccus sp. 1_MG-2023]